MVTILWGSGYCRFPLKPIKAQMQGRNQVRPFSPDIAFISVIEMYNQPRLEYRFLLKTSLSYQHLRQGTKCCYPRWMVCQQTARAGAVLMVLPSTTIVTPNSPGFDNCKIGGNGATESRRHSSPPLSSSHFIFEFTEKGIQTTAKPSPLPPLLVFESPFQWIQKGKESRKGKNVINHFF